MSETDVAARTNACYRSTIINSRAASVDLFHINTTPSLNLNIIDRISTPVHQVS